MFFISTPFNFFNVFSRFLTTTRAASDYSLPLATGALMPLRQRSSHRGVTTAYAFGSHELVVTVLYPNKAANSDIKKAILPVASRVFTRIKPTARDAVAEPFRPQIRYTSTPAVYAQVMRTLGEHLPERGGLLGGNRQTGEITHFWLDAAPLKANHSTYEPNYIAVNAQLRRWNDQGIGLIGMVHSHPGRFKRPSGADSSYARNILRAIPAMERFFMPIVVTRAQAGSPKLHSYVVQRNSARDYDECQWLVTPAAIPPQSSIEPPTKTLRPSPLQPASSELPMRYRLAL